MRRMRKRTLLICSLAALAVMAGGCTNAASPDKAGGAEEPVVLRMANGYSSLNYEPAVAYFVDRVAELSDGALRIEVVNEWADFASDFEQQIIDDVATGQADLGWVGTRIFDTVNVSSFQALTAPMLIDSYPLQEAVIESDIPGQMLEGIDTLGVAGLAVLADGLRKPIAVDAPLLGPDDWRGITFQTFMSEAQSEAIRALGAEATDVFETLDDGLASGEIQGFEKNLLVYQINGMAGAAPYVTANVNLWPQTVVILADPDRLATLSEQDREWLSTAADDAVEVSSGLADEDAAVVENVCRSGARLANATEADLIALREAFAPVYDTLKQDSQTAEFIDQIESMKQSTPAGDGLAIPATCTGVAEASANADQSETTGGQDTAELNGVYRWTLTEDDIATGGTGPEIPGVFTATLQDGAWSLTFRSDEGELFTDATNEEFTVSGDRIAFQLGGTTLNFTFAIDEEGNLELTPVEPMNAGDQFVLATHQWLKIEEPASSADAAIPLNGIYRWTLTGEDAVASGTQPTTPENLATFPWVMTLTLDEGKWDLTVRSEGEDSLEATDEQFDVAGDRVTFNWEGAQLEFTFVVDEEGNLELTPVEPMEAGDQFVWATYPLVKIE
jgi:TRAP-type C4-dicarboxylate transport system substrate-binding protein